MVSMIGRAPRIMAAAFAAGAVEIAMFYFLPVYATRLGFDEKTAVLLLAFGAAGSIVLQIPLGVSGGSSQPCASFFTGRFCLCTCPPWCCFYRGAALGSLSPYFSLFWSSRGSLYVRPYTPWGMF